MSDTVPVKIIDRIRKLLAMSASGSGATEAEATTYAEKAQELLGQWNLEMSEVGSGETSAVDGTRTKDQTKMSAAHEWQANLMSSVARNNFCFHATKVVHDRRANGTGKMRDRRRHFLVGRQVNIEMTVGVYSYLVASMERLCPYEDSRGRSYKSWFDGCVERLSARLTEQRQMSEAESRARRAEPSRGSGTDLVLADVYSSEEDLNYDFRFDLTPGTTAARRAKREQEDRDAAAQYRAYREANPYPTPSATEVSTHVETPAERKAREKQERASARWHESYERRQEKAESKIDRTAYRQGQTTGGEIGLDRQVGSSRTAGRISS